jgi:hypothetical protein
MSRNNWLNAQEDTPHRLADRWVNADQEITSTSDIASIAYAMFDVDSRSPTTAFLSTTFSTSCIYSILRTDGHWYNDDGELADLQGYQVLLPFPASAFPRDSKHIQAELTVTPTTGDPFPIIYKFAVTRKLYGS